MSDTEVVLAGGERVRVAGEIEQAENAIVSAARGSILELAWLTEAGTGRRVGINPDHVLMIRSLDGAGDGPRPSDAVPGSGRADHDLMGAPITPDR